MTKKFTGNRFCNQKEDGRLYYYNWARVIINVKGRDSCRLWYLNLNNVLISNECTKSLINILKCSTSINLSIFVRKCNFCSFNVIAKNKMHFFFKLMRHIMLSNILYRFNFALLATVYLYKLKNIYDNQEKIKKCDVEAEE